MPPPYDIAIIGAGAAGLMAAIWAGRSRFPLGEGRGGVAERPRRIIALEGAKRLGAKILVAGGGRCNVTHHEVDERAFAGSSPHAIKKVLRQFDVPRTVEFFRELGVELKREETGKLFPTTDDAHTVLDALLRAAANAGVDLQYPWRVGAIRRDADGFVIEPAAGESASHGTGVSPTPPQPSPQGGGSVFARRVIIATGGKSLPKTGSDGLGYELVRSVGHTITPRVFPALVPLTLPKDHFLTALSGLTVPATAEIRSATGKRLKSFTNSTLCTHFGLSGPSILDTSRYYSAAKAEDPGTQLVINWLPGLGAEELDALLVSARGVGVARWLAEQAPIREHVPGHTDRGIPDRLARALCQQAGVDPSAPVHTLTREARRSLVRWLTQTPLPVTGDRGYTYAEVTAGGVPLSELHLDTMESRVCPGLHLCGEICDVDGRIGGFNFQWAWASGYVAGRGAARG
jgi:predicted flavoprotein YhiN